MNLLIAEVKHPKFKFEELILWEDQDYFVLNKPPFVSTLQDRADPTNLLTLARNYSDDAQACHRLDKDTSGAIAFAKNPEAYRHLSMQFEHREVSKIYHAVADGIHNFKDQLLDAPILKMDDGVAKISKREGKEAQTYFTSLKLFRNYTLIECRPITGRMHQIRVHLAYLKAPITGDEQYGGKPFYLSSVKRDFNLKKQTEEQPIMNRMALHAYALTFQPLVGEEKVTIKAPYPKDMQALIRQLELNS